MGIVRAGKIKYDEVDAKKRILNELGDISEYKMLNNRVLVATYIRPEKTSGGIIVNTEEDEFQSKTGLIVAVGPSAFVEDGKWFKGYAPKVHDWVAYKASAGQNMDVNGVKCRVFADTAFDCIVPEPDSVW